MLGHHGVQQGIRGEARAILGNLRTEGMAVEMALASAAVVYRSNQCFMPGPAVAKAASAHNESSGTPPDRSDCH